MASPFRTLVRRFSRAPTATKPVESLSSIKQPMGPSRVVSQPTPYSHPWLLNAGEIAPGHTASTYAARRKSVSDALPENTMLLLPAAQRKFKYDVVPYTYRPCSRLRYLTGVTEPGAVLALTNQGAKLYTMNRDENVELWEGPRLGACADTSQWLGVDVEPLAELEGLVGNFIRQGGREARVIHDNSCPVLRTVVSTALQNTGAKADVVSHHVPTTIVDTPRLIKDENELALLRRSCGAMAGAINDAMAQFSANTNEGYISEASIASTLSYSAQMRGADDLAYPPVVAGGSNGTVLHYMASNQRVLSGELVYVDAGCEVSGYCSDISRAWPVNGRFNLAQLNLYEMILDVHKASIEMARPAVSLDKLHEKAVIAIVTGLMRLGFFAGQSLPQVLSTGAYAKFFPHAVGHYLGLQVHDTHSLRKSLPLQPGMCITIEPGVYVNHGDPDAPQKYWGIGFRVEDDLVIRDNTAPEVLSEAAVIEVRDIQQMVGSAVVKWQPLR